MAPRAATAYAVREGWSAHRCAHVKSSAHESRDGKPANSRGNRVADSAFTGSNKFWRCCRRGGALPICVHRFR